MDYIYNRRILLIVNFGGMFTTMTWSVRPLTSFFRAKSLKTAIVSAHLLYDSCFWRRLLCSAPACLSELCRPVSGLPGRQALRSSVTGQLLLPRAKTATRQCRTFSIVGPTPGMDSPWKSASCLKIMILRFAGCLRLICIAVVGLGAPLSRFLEGAPHKFLNE